ncbi:hypothetical protein BGZ67_005601 [Mortierella alpina]|nr:hypothetical protein BGZ67_005601 [Mortierella alpina]
MATLTSEHKPKGTSAIAPDIKVRTKDRTKAHPHPYLHGNFYPVSEETVGDDGIECEVVGVIPESLRGSQYVRTGMLHGVYFESGDKNAPIKPRYMNRWVRSEIFKKENDHGPLTLSLGLIMAGAEKFWTLVFYSIWYRIKSAFYQLKNDCNGNTALTFFGSRLLALQEAGKPIETSVPSLNTTGEYYFEEKEGQNAAKKGPSREVVTAHPKIDPNTGEFIFFSWRVKKPYAYYSVVSAEGKRIVWEEPIPGLKKAVMMHDFATTPTRSIIVNVPYFVDPVKHRKEGKPVIAFDSSSPARFGIIPRYFDSTKDEVIWFETRACHIFHTANAWDEKDSDGKVVAVCMTACRSERFISDINRWQPSTPGEHDGGKTAEEYQKTYMAAGSGKYDQQDPDATYLTLFRFDLKTRQTQMTTLSTSSTEFPVINWDRYMQPDLRYTFGATIEEPQPGVGVKFNGIIKTDIQAVIQRQQQLQRSRGKGVDGDDEGQWELGAQELKEVQLKTSQSHRFGPHMFGGEALFVPNAPRKDGQPLEEDDGHLLVYVYDERQMEEGVSKRSKEQVTELWIFDAKTVGQEHGPVAKVKIPRRVPYGFHGLLVTKEQIQENVDLLSRRAQASRV